MPHLAESIAASLGEDYVKRRVWTALARSAAEQGEYDRVHKIAVRQDGKDDHARTLTHVAVTMGSQGRVEEAVETLAEAERLARSIADDGSCEPVMVDIAVVLASIGAFSHAHAVASSIKDADCQTQVFVALQVDFDSVRRSRALGRLLQLAPWHVSARQLIRMNPDFLRKIRCELAALPDVDSLEHRPVPVGVPIR